MMIRDVATTASPVGAVAYALLRDGSQVCVRRALPADAEAMQTFFLRQSPESRAFRFHSGGVGIGPDVVSRALAGQTLVAERNGRTVGVASFYPLRDPERAEMALAVDDAEQGKGIGTILFEHLSADARRAGIRQFLALVLAGNRKMIDLVRGLGFELRRSVEGGEIEYDVELREGDAYVAAADARRHVAASASLEPLFHPRSVAVVGASRRRGSISHVLFHNLLTGGFDGPIYPVNPSTDAVASVRAYPRVSAIPDPVDLAVIAVPAAAVLDAARDCLEAGVKALVVISAGFAEVSNAGRQQQDALLELCRAHGARLVGPNCMGVLVNGPDGALNATFAPTLPPPGNVAVASQSGALGIAILQQAKQLGIGIASFVSMGNKADLSSNDLLERWEDHPATDVIVLYLESFGNPRRFARVARRVGRRKPIVAVKGGRAPAGQRAAASHTAALAGSEVAVDALFRQAGVIRCDTLDELFGVSSLLANQPLPRGNRVGIITNAGGLGILCADACEANGLELPTLSEETRAKLRALLPAEAAVGNPVDMLASGSANSYGDVLRIVLDDAAVDAAVVLFIPPLVTDAADVARALVQACDPPPEKPVLTCFVGTQGMTDVLRGTVAIPSYTYPEAAARALGHAARRAAWLRRPVGTIPTFPDLDPRAARKIVAAALERDAKPWLGADEVTALLAAYGIQRPTERVVHSPEEAAAASVQIGVPVAVKLVSRTIVHKTEAGGVQLDCRTPVAAAAAYRTIQANLDARGLLDQMDGVIVQPMLNQGVECLVGVSTDPVFGPLIAFGLGGVNAEIVGDVRFQLHPLTDLDADALIQGSKAARLLAGYRGSPAGDVPALRELLLRLSRLVEDLPEVSELDLNPVVVRPLGQGSLALDARVRLSRPT